MVSPPGDGCDLDAQVDEAIAKNNPNALLVDQYNHSDTKLLKVVAIHGRLDLAKRLLSAGATMSAKEFAHVIGWWCDAGMTVLLLERGVPFDAICLETALQHELWDTFFALLAYGGDIEEAGSHGVRPLHVAVWSGTSKGLDAAHSLLTRGANPNSRDYLAVTPLMKACDSKNPVKWTNSNIKDMMEDLLLERGADVNAQSRFGETALLLCVSEKPSDALARIKTVRKLLKAGANPNTLSPQGTTALMFAARDNDGILVRALLNAGADATIKTPDGRTARDIAKEKGSKKVVALLPQKISLRDRNG